MLSVGGIRKGRVIAMFFFFAFFSHQSILQSPREATDLIAS